MRKPLLALSLALTAGIGAIPVAEAIAAPPPSSTHSSTSPATSSFTTNGSTANSQARSVSGAAIVATAMKYLGYPYTATGNSPSTGFSCIGFVSFVYKSNGIPLPGDLGDALAYAQQVPFSALEPGDILYFQNTVWNGLSHAAIYIGGGKFIHAEWYNRGVVVSSFYNDPHDGNYWIGKYLGANRPWAGAAMSAVLPSQPQKGVPQPTTSAGVSATTQVGTGPSALVSVPSLNVRSSPSKNSVVQTVVTQGTSVVVLGQKGNWYKVQLPNGQVGWVVAAGIGQATVNPTVGTPSAPQVQGYPTKRASSASAAVKANTLNVHSSPSINAPVVNSVSKGQKVQVIGRRGQWLKVVLPDGSVGWISSAYTTVHSAAPKKSASATSASATARTSTAGGSKAKVAVNVRSGPSLTSSVVTTIPAGGTYRVLGWSNGWAHVQLPNGTAGWVSGTVIGSSSSGPTYSSYTPRRSARTTTKGSTGASARNVLTAGVRVHSSPGVKAPVVTVAAAGTHVAVLGYRGSWVLVRLPNGTTGYVLGSYVR